MKMRLIHRMILVIGALIVFLIGIGLIVSACGLIPNFTLIPETETESFYNWKRITVIVCGAFLVLFGAYTMVFPGKLRYKKKDFIVQKTESGDLLISIKALESMVNKCVDMHEEIQVKRMNILPGKDGIIVNLKIAMANNVAIPLATSSLSKQIKQYVMASSGVQVSNVIVAVDSTGGEVGSGANPYAVKEEARAAEKTVEDEKNEEKKLPHLRVFRREEEPATVPVAQEPAAEAVQAVQETAAEVQAKAEEAVQDVQEAVAETAETVGEAVADAAEDAAEGAKKALETAGEAVDKFTSES